MDIAGRTVDAVPEGTLDPAAGLNESIRQMLTRIVPIVIAMDQVAPPSEPDDGDAYIVAASGTGDWSGHDDELAVYVEQADGWAFVVPEQVRLVVNEQDGGLYKWDGESDGAWGLYATTEAASAAVVEEAGTNLDAAPGNSGNYTRFTNAGEKTYTFDSSEDYEVGAEYHGRNAGAGDLTIVPGDSDMIINAPYGGSLVVPEGGTFTVKIVAIDSGSVEADLFGVTESA